MSDYPYPLTRPYRPSWKRRYRAYTNFSGLGEEILSLLLCFVPLAGLLFWGLSQGAEIPLANLLALLQGTIPSKTAVSWPHILTLQVACTLAIFVWSQGMRFVIGAGKATSDLNKMIHGSWLSALLVLCLGAPLIEEVLFRLIPLQLLGPWLGVYLMLIVSTLIFALTHITNLANASWKVVRVVPHAALGIVFAYVFLAHGFWAAVAVHALHNFLVLISARLQRFMGIIS